MVNYGELWWTGIFISCLAWFQIDGVFFHQSKMETTLAKRGRFCMVLWYHWLGEFAPKLLVELLYMFLKKAGIVLNSASKKDTSNNIYI